jgi:hypothetical protein
MRDLAHSGSSILSFLMDMTHIVGMAHGAPLARNVRYSARVILSYVSLDCMPNFSLWKLSSRNQGEMGGGQLGVSKGILV